MKLSEWDKEENGLPPKIEFNAAHMRAITCNKPIGIPDVLKHICDSEFYIVGASGTDDLFPGKKGIATVYFRSKKDQEKLLEAGYSEAVDPTPTAGTGTLVDVEFT